MQECPFFNFSWWDGSKCKAKGNGDGEPVDSRFECYCGRQTFSKDYHDCPLYQEATGTRRNEGCYLTTACMSMQKEHFDDNCKELTVLRGFRDSYVKKYHFDDISEYYQIAPSIVDKINSLDNNQELYRRMYTELIEPCCQLITEEKLEEAYNLYKNYSINLKAKYLN